MEIRRVTDPQAWDQSLLELPNPHVLQSWAWGQFKERHGWHALRLLFQDQGRTVAAASVLQRKLPRLPVSILYVAKGPALDWTDAPLAERVVVELEHLTRRRRALLVKIDPDVYFPDGLSSVSPRPGRAVEMAHLLTARGWHFSQEQVQFRNTVLLDLRLTEDDLLAAMKQKTRYNTRLAARRGVGVRPGTVADVDQFYQLYTETAQRDGFLIRPAQYYRDAWGSFIEARLAHLLLAEVQGEVVAGIILFTFGPTAWYMYGASSERHRDCMPNNLLQWEAIRQAKNLGCTLYDLWGAPDQLDSSDPMWGVAHFKLGMGGQLARGLGAWDYPGNPGAYRLYSLMMPRFLSFLRRRQPGSQTQAAD